ncbi:MAG: flagellar hook-basal body complex protein FliE [Salinispira sp.]
MNIQFTAHHLMPSEVRGDIFTLKTTDPDHIKNTASIVPEGQKSFGQMLFDTISEVNADQQFAHDISTQSIVNPDSVEAHDVTIALAKANLSLSITKNVVDRVVQAYRDITTLR